MDVESFTASILEGKVCVAPDICADCPNPPDPADQYESEICGDDDNSGCNTTPPAYEDIVLPAPCDAGWAFCGTAWADGGMRDTDWWRFTLPQATEVTATIQAQNPTQAFFLEVSSCICTPTQGLMFSEVCTEGTMTETLCAGSWVLIVANGDSSGGAIFDGFPCPVDPFDTSNAYTCTLSCAAPESGACCNGLACSVVASECDCSGVFFVGETCNPPDPVGHVCN